MVPAIRAEWRKLFSVRSTYILSGIAMLIIAGLSFWALGIKGSAVDEKLFMEAVEISGMASLFVAIIAILLITHEYRYNTIMYTLTASSSRSKVLFAKFLVITLFATIFTFVAAAWAVAFTLAGNAIGPGEMITQQFYFLDTTWRSLFGFVGYVWAGLLFGVLLRHVVGALVVFMIVPSTLEQLLGMVLNDNVKYLPFTALQHVQYGGALSPGKAALVFSAYLVVGWAIAWILFVKRDAN